MSCLFWLGGLRPILSQVVLDKLCIAGLLYVANSENNTTVISFLLLIIVITIIIVITVGYSSSDRWTLTFPVLPFVVLQVLRLFLSDDYYLLRISSNLCVLVAMALCALFPPVQLRPPTGPHNIGVVDVFLPLDNSTKSNADYKLQQRQESDHVTARIFYPAASYSSYSTTASTPYLNPPHFANQLCQSIMKYAAPPPLNKCGWMLYTWKLIRIPAVTHAPVLQPPPTAHDSNSNSSKGWPCVIHSHGLYGSPHMYTHQALELASHGTVVLMIHHQDGSSPFVMKQDGTTMEYDDTLKQLYAQGPDMTKYIRTRRAQTHFRVMEFLAAFQSLELLNRGKMLIPTLVRHNVSFEGTLDTSNVTFLGHSFGAATALTAAAYRPDIPTAVIAHEPAVDWMTDFGRRALLEESRMKGSMFTYTGGTGGFSDEEGKEQEEELLLSSLSSTTTRTLHDIPMLILYSDQWAKSGWGGFPLLNCMHQRGEFGPRSSTSCKRSSSSVEVVSKSHHQEFSDTCALTPLWIGRKTGATGERNPLDTLDEIMGRTLAFFQHDVRREDVCQ